MNLYVATLIVLGATALAVGIMLLIRRHAPDGGYFNDGDRAAGVFGVLATSFSVLLAFVVFLAFTSYDKAQSGADQEAMDVVQQFQTAQALPRAVAPLLGGELICYGRSVVYQEWPQLQRSGTAPDFNEWTFPLFKTLQKTNPVTPAEQAAYAKWLDETSDRQQARLDRVDGAQNVIPTPLWFILLVGAGIVLLFTFFFADSGERKVAQVMMAGSVAVVLATSMLVIQFFDSPYHPGSGSLQPTSMLRSLERLDGASKALGLPVVVPCDAAGRPPAKA